MLQTIINRAFFEDLIIFLALTSCALFRILNTNRDNIVSSFWQYVFYFPEWSTDLKFPCNDKSMPKLYTYKLIRVKHVDILERSGGQFRWEASLQSNRYGSALFQCCIWLWPFIFIVVIVPNLDYERHTRHMHVRCIEDTHTHTHWWVLKEITTIS